MTVLAASTETLNSKEQAQWMLHQLVPGRGICNIGFAFRVGLVMRWRPLQEALNRIRRRHPALRTTVRATGSRLARHIGPAEDAELPLAAHSCSDEVLDELVTRLVAGPLDVENGPLIKAHLITLPAGSALCVVLHHLVGDAISVQTILRDLAALYDAFAEGREPPAEVLAHTPLYSEPAADPSTLEYWREHLAGVDPARLALACAKPDPARPSFAGDRIDHSLSPAAVAAVARLRAKTRATDNIVLLAAYYLLLARHGAGPDLVVSVLTNARRVRAASAIVGFHANTLPVRVHVDLGRGFTDLVSATRDAFLRGLEHGDLSFESLQQGLDLRAVNWRVPLFRHSFNYRPPADGRMTIGGAPVEIIDAYSGMSRLDMELLVWAEPDALNLTAVFSTEVHDRADVAAMLGRYERLILELDADADAPVGQLDLTTSADRRLLSGVNRTTR